MKTIYLVRHGESETNLRNYTFGDEKAPLTVRGRQQAAQIAKRCAKLSIEVIIASPMTRARETAAAIARENKVPVETSDLFRERKMPTSLTGTDRYEEHLQERRNGWFQSFYRGDLRIEDAENFSDVKERAGRALSFLEDRQEETILVVAHGFFLRTLLARIVLGDDVAPEELKRIMLHVRLGNAGLSVLHFDPDGTETYDNMPMKGWSVRIWNDHAHLG